MFINCKVILLIDSNFAGNQFLFKENHHIILYLLILLYKMIHDRYSIKFSIF